MRNLNLPALYRAHPLYLRDEDFDAAREIRKDSGRIISAASAIENIVAEIISNTIFREVKEHRDIVLGSVLSSDWCTFSAKHKLLKVVLEKFVLTDGKVKNKIDENLRNVMSYRNAFAHGTLGLCSDTFKQELHYYSNGASTTVILDDDYFNKLEKTFQEVWQELQKIQEKLGQ